MSDKKESAFNKIMERTCPACGFTYDETDTEVYWVKNTEGDKICSYCYEKYLDECDER